MFKKKNFSIPPGGFPPLTDDQVFKYFFNRHPELLQELTNGIRALEYRPPIQELRLLSTEIPREQQDDRGINLDLLAEDEHGNAYHVEMQSYRQKEYGDQMVFRTAAMQFKQLSKGEGLPQLRETWGIRLVKGFRLKDLEGHFWESFSKRGRRDPDLLLSDKDHDVLVQLEDFNPKHYREVKTPWRCLLYVIKYTPDLKEEEMEYLKQQVPGLEAGFQTLSAATKDVFLKIAQDKRRRERADFLEQGLSQGLAQGISQGIAQGINQGVMKTARNMLQLKKPLEEIAEVTELSLQDIQKLDQELKAKG